jgi:regulator of protease activity HflC (stomatin/prohibitin superfamily)
MIRLFLFTSPAAVFGLFFLGIIVLFFLVVIIRAIVIVSQGTTVIVQRLGKFHKVLPAGIHITIPVIDSKVATISLKERVYDFPPQPVITKDNVTMQIDTVVYFQVTDPKLFTYGVERPLSAMENLTATTLRNLIGDLELDQTLTSRDRINHKMWETLEEATDSWGIKVNRVELKNIIPPRDIQEAMEKQMRAERQKREAILEAEGKKQAAILTAEGEKQAAVLRAEAVKIKKITEAEGEATAILRVYEAQAKGVKLINEAQPNPAFLTLKGFETLEKVANGNATKLIIPSEIQNVTGLLASLKEAIIDDQPLAKKKPEKE